MKDVVRVSKVPFSTFAQPKMPKNNENSDVVLELGSENDVKMGLLQGEEHRLVLG
jgi:hypothetical protein